MHNESQPTTVYAITENFFESGAGGLGGISPDRSPTKKSSLNNGNYFDDAHK